MNSSCFFQLRPLGFRFLTVLLVLVHTAMATVGVFAGPRDASSEWWSFRAPRRVALPAVLGADWPRNPIDRFVLARLEAERIGPSSPAPPRTLVRRAFLDLTGLPPTPREVDAFLADTQPDAFERLVDSLLDSPRHGERWARHWLDVARYADSQGGEVDLPREMWVYRDWVIDAFNRDMPADEFITGQLAGDLLPEATDQHHIATGFLRCGVYDKLKGNGDNEVARLETVFDRVNTTGSVFLGMTLACAQCHDHKYDPISIEEYYRLYAIFNDVDDVHLGLPSKAHLARYKAVRQQIEALRKERSEYEKKNKGEAGRWETNLSPEERVKLSPEAQAALLVGREIRDEEQRRAVMAAFWNQDPGHLQRGELIARLEDDEPERVLAPVTYQRATPRTTRVFERGDIHSPGKEVDPAVPAVFAQPSGLGGRMTRLDLARWLVRPDHPLTARVLVNRIWQRYFGQGLVRTENDFGTRGSRPTHPELLDYLARRLVDGGWSLKRLHREIVTSATYRQSSRVRDDLVKADSENLLLGRQERLRLEAESIRDVVLAASGLLSTKIGGPSVFPPQPGGIMSGRATPFQWAVSDGEDRYRRGMYTHFWRLTPHPFLRTFDAPESMTSCTRRYRSNTPLQALTLLNGPSFVEAAEGLARRVVALAESGDSSRIRFAFEICVARPPREEEVRLLAELLAERRKEFRSSPELARKFLGGAAVDVVERASWTAVCRALLNLDEVITRG